MRNPQVEYCSIILVAVLSFILFLSNARNANSCESYSALKSKVFLRWGLHEDLYGVWIFSMYDGSLTISGSEFNNWSGVIGKRWYEPDYKRTVWEESFTTHDVERIISALNKGIDWSKISSEHNIKRYQKDLIQLGKRISMYFDVSESGKTSVVFRHAGWICRDRTRDGRYEERFIELWLDCDVSDNSHCSVAEVLIFFRKCKEEHEEYLKAKAKYRKLRLEPKDWRDRLFQ